MATDHNFRIKNGLHVQGGTATFHSVNNNSDLVVGGVINTHDSGSPARITTSSTGQLYLDSTTGQDLYLGWWNSSSANIITEMKLRAPSFYDRNDTGYYVNPATSSVLNNIDMRGTSTLFPGHAYSNTHDGTNVYWHIGSAGGSTNKVLNLRVYQSDNSNYTTHRFMTTGANITGNLNVTGNLTVTGSIDRNSVTDLDVVDKTITLGVGQTEANSGNSGIIIDGSAASMLWNETNSRFDFNKPIKSTGKIEAAADMQMTHIYNAGNFYSLNTGGSGWDTVIARNGGSPYADMKNSYRISGTTVIDASRALVNINYLTTGGNVNTTSGAFQINGTTVIDSSKNIIFSTHGHIFTTNNANNAKLTTSATGASGLLLENTGGNFMAQIYGDGTNYGFLNGVWASWDLKKITNGRLHLNNNNTYYIQPESTSYFNTMQASVYKIGTTTVIDGSRNLTNIGTISSGAITTSGAIVQGTGQSHYFRGVDNNWRIGSDIVTDSGGLVTSAATQMIVGGAGNLYGFQIFGHQTSTSPCFEVIPNSSVANSITNVRGSLYVANTQAIHKSGNYMVYGDGSGNPALYAGNTADNRNYYQATYHRWRSDDATTAFGEMSTTGLVIGGTFTPTQRLHVEGNARINQPDLGGSPAMTALLEMYGYEGRGVGIKMRDNANSASGASNREWFVGTGYGQGGFNIGYSSTGSQSSYAAQNKLALSTDGNLTIAGTISSGATTITSSTSMLLTLNPTANNYGGILYQYGGATKGSAIYNAGMMNFGGEASVSTVFQAGGQYGLFIHHSTRNVGIGTGTSAPGQKLTVAGGHIKLDSGYSLQWSDSHERIEQSDGHLEFFVNNGEAMTLDTTGLTLTGNLGVGIAASTDTFHPLKISDSGHNYVWIQSTTGTNEAMTRYSNPTSNNWYTGIRNGTSNSLTNTSYHVYSSAFGATTGGWNQSGQFFTANEGYALGSFRAPLFYDSADTSFFVDPASSHSKITGLNIFGGSNQNTNDGTLYVNKTNNNDWLIKAEGTGSTTEYGITVRMPGTHTVGYEATAGGVQYYRVGTDMVLHNASIRSPIFYDSNNTAYYLDASSTGTSLRVAGNADISGTLAVGGVVTLTGPVARASHHAGGFLQGSYNNVGANGAKSNPIYTIGSAYNPAETTLANMYGIGFSDKGSSPSFFPSSFQGGWGMYVAADGDARIFLDGSNGHGTFIGQVRATGFYDIGNTAYYLDPGVGTTALYTNGAWRQTSTNWTGEVAGKMQYHANNWYIQSSSETIFRNASGVNTMIQNMSSGQMTLTGDLRLSANANLTRLAHYSGHLEGSYNNVGGNGSKSNPIYTIGSSYNPDNNGTTLANMYGIGYTNVAASFISGGISVGDWGMYVAADGDARIWLDGSGGAAAFAGNTRSTAHYDIDNTAYYLDPAHSTTSLEVLGSIRVKQGSHAHGNLELQYDHGTTGSFTDTTNSSNMCMWVSEPGISYSNGGIGVNIDESGPYYGRRINAGFGSWIQFRKDNGDATFKVTQGNNGSAGTHLSNLLVAAGGSVTARTDLRAPVFYDSANTAYYTDPASNSILSSASIGTTNVPSGGYSLRVQSIQMNGSGSLDYIGQLHFNDNVRFYQDGNDSYLNYKYGDTGAGGIKVVNGSGTLQGYLYADSLNFGLLSSDGSWAVQATNAKTMIHHRVDTPIVYDIDNTAYFMDLSTNNDSIVARGTVHIGPEGNLGLGDLSHPKIAYPGEAAQWGGNGTTTGQIIIDLPGTLANYDMMYIEIDVFEYDGKGGAKIIIGTHNWNSGGDSGTGNQMWYNTDVRIVGRFDHDIYLGWRNNGSVNKRVIVLGTHTSSWIYGTVHVAKVSGATYYTNSIDWTGDWNVTQNTSSSAYTKSPTTNWNDSDSRNMRVHRSIQGNRVYADADMRSPLYYDNNNTTYYTNPASTSLMNGLQLAGSLLLTAEGATNIKTRFIMGKASGSTSSGDLFLNYGTSHSVYVGGTGNLYLGGELHLSDNKEIKIGSGDDFRLSTWDGSTGNYYHDNGSMNVIETKNTVTGLEFHMNNKYFQIMETGPMENPIFKAQYGVGVEMYHAPNGTGGSLVTSSTGITINGTKGINALHIGRGDAGIQFDASYNAVIPYRPDISSGTADNYLDLGRYNVRWDDVFATNGTIQTSDQNEKQDFEALSDAETRVAVAAKGLLKKFRWKSAVEKKGDDARTHFGIIAQDLKAAFEAEGLDASKYGMFTSNTWFENGQEHTRMGIRYSELLAFIISAI